MLKERTPMTREDQSIALDNIAGMVGIVIGQLEVLETMSDKDPLLREKALEALTPVCKYLEGIKEGIERVAAATEEGADDK